MIFLKANAELKYTFERLIKTMNVPVKWNSIFAVLNNYLILTGEVRSLVFNFDNRKVNTNIIEIPIAEEAIKPVEDNVLLTNVINMILYAFGKWGTIPGIKVEKDYAQLNELFTGLLRELKIEPGYRDDNFRFYQKGIQIAYEDVVQAAIEAGKKEEEEEETEEEKLGLWHNMRWVTAKGSFAKKEISVEEQTTTRIGNNFYPIGYLCPNCGKKLHMVVYPVDKEFPVETDEGKVYLARAYVCDNCNRFYTPRPGKLLSEGDIYLLDFEEDREAYEDYQELLGKRGEKTSNYKFNEYEWERNKKKEDEAVKGDREQEQGESDETEEVTAERLEELSEEEAKHLEEKRKSGFYGPERVKNHKELKVKTDKSRKNISQSKRDKIEIPRKSDRENLQEAVLAHKGREISSSMKEETVEKKQKEQKERGGAEQIERNAEKVREKYDARMKVAERMSKRQLLELKEHVKKEKLLSEPQKREYIAEVEKYIYRSKEKELQKRAENAGKGNYIQLCRTIEEIEKSDCPKEMKEPVLAPLYEMRQQKAQAEAEEMIAHMPSVMDRKCYKLFQEKLGQYKEADLSPYEEKLKERSKLAEVQEIETLVKHAGRSDRGAIFCVWQRLQEPDFSKENTRKPLEELRGRLEKLDEAAIDRICPDLTGMTFEEGLKVYEKIASGMFLPDIKSNALERIDKRLTKMKSDESELLVRKLKEELAGQIKDSSALHYYEARKAMMGEWSGTEADIIKCAANTYAAERGRYEYPIIVCDSTRKGTGTEGFLLTPDHLFYNSTFSSECIPIMNIKSISFRTGLLNKGIYVNQKKGEKTKIPVGLSVKDWGSFVRVLEEFVTYLQEKPESRKVDYLVKEEHEVKCCYRCGYVYKGGDVCPKCGNRANK